MSEEPLSDETIEQRGLMKTALRKGRKFAYEWAKKSGLLHWHEAGLGCTDKCLEGIAYREDTDRKLYRPPMPPPRSHRLGNIASARARRMAQRENVPGHDTDNL